MKEFHVVRVIPIMYMVLLAIQMPDDSMLLTGSTDKYFEFLVSVHVFKKSFSGGLNPFSKPRNTQ